MWSLIFDEDEALSTWAASRISPLPDGFGPCRAIGIATAPKVDPASKLLAVVVYHGFSKGCRFCEVSIAAISPRWSQRGVIRAALSVPFEQYGCRKVYGTILSTNKRACKLIKGLGFKGPAVLRHHFAQGQHAALYDMTQSEYRAKWSN